MTMLSSLTSRVGIVTRAAYSLFNGLPKFELLKLCLKAYD